MRRPRRPARSRIERLLVSVTVFGREFPGSLGVWEFGRREDLSFETSCALRPCFMAPIRRRLNEVWRHRSKRSEAEPVERRTKSLLPNSQTPTLPGKFRSVPVRTLDLPREEAGDFV